MARGIKQKKSIQTDFSITDAQKRAKTRRQQLNAAAGIESNRVDDISRELDEEGMTEMEKDLFEN